jgi:hypothetical protein
VVDECRALSHCSRSCCGGTETVASLMSLNSRGGGALSGFCDGADDAAAEAVAGFIKLKCWLSRRRVLRSMRKLGLSDMAFPSCCCCFFSASAARTVVVEGLELETMVES